MSVHRANPSEDEEAVAQFDAIRKENAALRHDVTRLLQDLSRAKTADEELRAELSTYLALVAHQLKSPLLPLEVSLMTIARAIERGTALPDDVFPRTLRQTRRLGRLIEMLLVDLPRAEEGSLRVTVRSFDLREPVERAVRDARAMLEARTFSLEAPESALMVQGDTERIEQIVCALIDNAVKYSPPEAPIEVQVTTDGRSYGMVSIKDKGIGIPSREINQVFTKFFRGSNAPSYLYRGLGVGLYLAHQLAKLCRGSLTVDSVEGEGTICRLHVPVET